MNWERICSFGSNQCSIARGVQSSRDTVTDVKVKHDFTIFCIPFEKIIGMARLISNPHRAVL